MDRLQQTINRMNVALTKLAFDGHDDSTIRHDSTIIHRRAKTPPSLIVLPERKIKEEQILHLIGTNRIPPSFQRMIATANIGNKPVSLISLNEIMGNIENVDFMYANDKTVRKATFKNHDTQLHLTIYTIKHDGQTIF